MIFTYQATTKEGETKEGTIEAPNQNLAISSLQARGLIILDIKGDSDGGLLARLATFGRKVKTKDIVFLSRQIATLFEAKVSALSTFRLMASETENPVIRRALTEVTDDIKGGMSISEALGRHPRVFSDFYVNMVASGEESGKLSENFSYLAEYLERSYELASKARNALIYPALVVVSFVGVVILMMVFVIPRLSEILEEVGGELPIYTRVVIGASDFVVNYGLFLFILIVAVAVFLRRYIATKMGSMSFDRFKLAVPYIGNLYKKIFLSRVADNLSTMVTSGIPMMKALETTAKVVDNKVYQEILLDATEAIKGGSAVSSVFYRYPEVPNIMVQMIKVGEESGKLGFILQTLARFYRREVDNEIATLVDLIEPALIVVLGLMVGFLLTAVLLPIYNLASSLT